MVSGAGAGNARGGMAERLEEGRKMVTQVGMDGKGIVSSLFFLFILSAKKLYKLI